MKKIFQYIYILILAIITLNCNKVFAAPELTCVYEGGTYSATYSTVLMQNSEGKKSIYINWSQTTDINAGNWILLGDEDINKINIESKFYNQDILSGCPNYTRHSAYKKEYYFYDEKTVHFDYKLAKNYSGSKIVNTDSEPITQNFVEYNVELANCKSLLGDPSVEKSPAWFLVKIFNLLKYIAIIILIVLSVLDFITAVASHENDELKKAVNKTIKRFIFCIIIFILPTLIKFGLKYLSKRSIDLCGIQ